MLVLLALAGAVLRLMLELKLGVFVTPEGVIKWTQIEPILALHRGSLMALVSPVVWAREANEAVRRQSRTLAQSVSEERTIP